MKWIKIIFIGLVVGYAGYFLAGCAYALGGITGGLSALSIKDDIVSMDTKETIKGDIGRVRGVSIQVFKEMGITLVSKEETWIKGETEKHGLVEIAWGPVTSEMFFVGVKSRYRGLGGLKKDILFSINILSAIMEKYRAGVSVVLPKKSAAPPPPAIAKKMLKTIKEGLVRAGPGSEFKVIAVVKSGSILFNLGKQKSWHKVQTEKGEVGFIYYMVVKPAQGI